MIVDRRPSPASLDSEKVAKQMSSKILVTIAIDAAILTSDTTNSVVAAIAILAAVITVVVFTGNETFSHVK